MTTYELYINDILCDLSSDEVVTLLYQSPIFSSLDSIQSNRSYNIALPPTPTNMRAIGHAARPDVDADAPYVRLPAALYQDGVPLFTQGFAVVTDITDTINVTLTWGNVDNFQPLFDANLRDLGPQLEELEAEHIDWNENTTILEGNTTNEYPGVAFWGVNFGMGLSNPKYLHPSVQVKTILSAIEKYNGITIDGKERLAYIKNLGPIIPLVSRNGDEVSNEAEALRFTANSTNFKNQIYGVLGRGNIIKDPHEIAYGPCTTKFNKTDLSVHITIKPSNGTGAYGYFTHRPPEWGDPKEMHIMLTELDGNSEIVKSTILGTSYNVELVGSTGDGVNIYRFNFVPLDITYPLIENTEILLHYEDPAGEIYISNPYSTPLTVNIWANWTDCAFPTKFPIAPNLPDMSQGDFVLSLMSMNGLFAYADKDSPNTIKLISIDDIFTNIENNDIIDWSDRVILNDFHRVDMPDASIFTIDDLAQSNILDYDNDDDVKTDTYGIITVQNENIEKETELVELPFSASENATTDGVNCALVPIYEDDGNGGANYSECSPRILSGRGAFMSGIARCIGVFDPWMKFGGENGIVKTRYASYQKVVDRLRIITIRAKLTALDLYNLDYTKPVYIAQFGQIFAIYSVETGEDGICDCQLLKLDVPYYILLDGKGENKTFNLSSTGQTINIPYKTNGTISIKSQTGFIDSVSFENGEIAISISENTTPNVRVSDLNLTVKENQSIERRITIRQAAAVSGYYLMIDGGTTDIKVSCDAKAQDLTFPYETNGTIFNNWPGGDGISKVTAQNGVITISLNKNTMNIPWIRDIRFGVTEDSSISQHIIITQEAPTEARMVVIDASNDPSLMNQSALAHFELHEAEMSAAELVEIQVDSECIIRLTFEQVASYIGIVDLAAFEGYTLIVNIPDYGLTGEKLIPATGDILISLE